MTADERRMSKKCPSVFAVQSVIWDEDRFIKPIMYFKNRRDAEKCFTDTKLGEDTVEVTMSYWGNPGCYLQRIILMREKSIAYDFDGRIIKNERRRIYATV